MIVIVSFQTRTIAMTHWEMAKTIIEALAFDKNAPRSEELLSDRGKIKDYSEILGSSRSAFHAARW